MSGLSSTLNIAQNAIAAQRAGLNITGHNVANVNNPDFSRQRAEHMNDRPIMYGGKLFGTGVKLGQVRSTVNQILENRLTQSYSRQAAIGETRTYLTQIEGIFNDQSGSGLNTCLGKFWNSWNDLSNNPNGAAQRVQVREQGSRLAGQFRRVSGALDRMESDVKKNIGSAVELINGYTSQVADLNRQIRSFGESQPANDLKDRRNALLDKLGRLIDIDVVRQEDGGVTVNVAGGTPLVSGEDSYNLSVKDNRVIRTGSMGSDITDKIKGGKLAGLLVVRDEVIPKYRNQINDFASEITWNMNRVHAQGAGQTYFTDSITGTYRADDSGRFSSLKFGDRIDYKQQFRIWLRDNSKAKASYRQVAFDMDISKATLGDFRGQAPGGVPSRYRFTVVDGADIGKKTVTQTNGERLGQVRGSTSNSVSSAVDQILADQILTIRGAKNGTHKIRIQGNGGDANKSMSSIADQLNKIPGVRAHAAKNRAEFQLDGITKAQDGDVIEYELSVGGKIHKQSLVVDSTKGSLKEQFQASLESLAKKVNAANGNKDLSVDGLKICSEKGATLGVQKFEVVDNAGIKLSQFDKFNAADKIRFNIASNGVPTTTTEVTVDLKDVDTKDQAAVSKAFQSALEKQLKGKPFKVVRNGTDNSIVLRTTNGADVTLKAVGGDTGKDASIQVDNLSGTAASTGNGRLVFDGTGDEEVFRAETSDGDTLGFAVPGAGTNGGAGTLTAVAESSNTTAGVNKAAAIVSSLTIVTDPGISLESDQRSAAGLLGTQGKAVTGNSIMTLGGDNGFKNFSAGDKISLDVDGKTVSFTVSSAPGGTTESALSRQLATALKTALPQENYTIVRNGKSVSVVKKGEPDTPIKITNFSDTGNQDAKLNVSTGTGENTRKLQNSTLDAGSVYRNSAESSLYDGTGKIMWERLDAQGKPTGSKGFSTVTTEGRVKIMEGGRETLSFNVSRGKLTEGNTMMVNTDANGRVDPMQMKIFQRANSVNETYRFKVVSGGAIGKERPDGKPIVIEWKSSTGSGRFEIPSTDTPTRVKVDGMVMLFKKGTLANGETFTVKTDANGQVTTRDADGHGRAETASQWHWTLNSFADTFNRKTPGMVARITDDNRLVFKTRDYYAPDNITYSGKNGFSDENAKISVKNWGALKDKATGFQFVRSGGRWTLANDPTGGRARILPKGGSDNGFMVDMDGDGQGDIEIKFKNKITGDGSVRFDLLKHDKADTGFAFGGSGGKSAGVAAALGINTFFTGNGAGDMGVNEKLNDARFLAAGQIDSGTGHINQGDNRNALAVGDLQKATCNMRQWHFSRGKGGVSNGMESSVGSYFSTMVSNMGMESRNAKSNQIYSDTMVKKLTQQRNAVSAVSLDEEMIRMMKYQHAYQAASKLLKITDEMMNTLISSR